jgi:hypothetical protein
MSDKNLSPREDVAVPDTRWMSLIFGPEAPVREAIEEGTEEKQETKLDLFEKGLAQELSTGDTIDQAFTKIVKMALCAEFGPSFVKDKGAKGMTETIVRGIMGDSALRKQALMIVDRFAKK